MTRKLFRWTPEIVEQLRQLAAEGHPLSEIARRIGVSEGQANMAMWRRGISLDKDAVKRRQAERGRTLQKVNKDKWLAAMQSREYRDKRRRQMEVMWADEEYREKQSALIRAEWSQEKWREKLSEWGKKAAATTNEKIRNKKLQRIELRRKAEAQAAEERRYREWLNTLSPFERQLELVRSGRAQLVRNI